MLQYDELQLCNIVWVHPVFGGLPDEVLLASTSCTVTFDRVSPRSYKVVELGELDDERIVIILEEGLRFQSCGKDRLKMPFCLFLLSISAGPVRAL